MRLPTSHHSHLLRQLSAPLAGALACLALAACPPTDPPEDTVEPDGDVTEVAETTPPDSTLPTDCEVDADCIPPSGAPACKALSCLEGECVSVSIEDGLVCDDDNPCTPSSACADGVCVADDDPCDDNNPCTTDACDPANGCVNTNNQLPCDDGDACTTGDACRSGSCQGDPADCDDNNACTEDLCSGETGCSYQPIEGGCDDDNACTTNDTCLDGACQPGAPLTCGDPNDPCQTSSCDPQAGCMVEIFEGPCDDGNVCTENDTCTQGICTGSVLECDDNNPCTDDYCDATDGCTQVNNLLPCSDGDPCTIDDVCAGGVCGGGGANPLCCTSAADCDDEDSCTTDDCVNGMCSATPLDCDDGVACTADACDDGGCVFTPFGPVSDTPEIFDSLESGLGAWTIVSNNPTVTWQADTSFAADGATSLYCGDPTVYTYDAGLTVASASRTVIVPPGAAALTFSARGELAENVSCLYDVVRIYVDGTELSPPLCALTAEWVEHTYDVSEWAGLGVQLTFEFDTFDDQSNNAAGVWIDSLAVATDSTLSCCTDNTECSGGVGCQAELCSPVAFDCRPDDPAVLCDDGDPCTADSCMADGTCSSTPIPGCP